MSDKQYYIINNYINTEIKVRNSVFIAHLSPVNSIEEAKDFISEISSKYKDATHNCWAYIVGKKAEIFHSSDSGEPAGTAGKPILGSLQKHNLTNIAAVVSRYYGGVKLGVRGLIDAYSESTEKSLSESDINEFKEYCSYLIITAYEQAENFKHKISGLNGEIVETNYSENVSFTVTIEEKNNEELVKFLSEFAKRKMLSFQKI